MVAVAAEDRRVLVQEVVFAGIPFIGIERSAARSGIVIKWIVAIGVREGKIREDLSSLSADAIRRNPIAGELRASQTGDGIACRRIVDCVLGTGGEISAEIAPTGGGGGNRGENGPAEALTDQLRIGEEEELVLNDFAADGAAELVEAKGGRAVRLGEGIAAKIGETSRAIAEVIEGRSVKLVGSRLRGAVYDSGAGVSKFRIVILRSDFGFAKR